MNRINIKREWLPICLFLLVLMSCKEREFNNPFDTESVYYVGKDISKDSDDNGIADVLEPEMALVPGSYFSMGADPIPRVDIEPMDISLDEQPAHRVFVDSFYIKTTEVTYGEFRAIFFEKDMPVDRDLQPVTGITWFDAVEYCNKLSEIHGFDQVYKIEHDVIEIDLSRNGYRLPTEAEWELAYGGDSLNLFFWGEDTSLIDDYAWYLHNSNFTAHQVGQKNPNEYGLYDMSGNVWEWVNDYYSEDYFSDSPVNNPQGPHNTEDRVAKGGGFTGARFTQRRSNRTHLFPKENHVDIGFRIAGPGAATP